MEENAHSNIDKLINQIDPGSVIEVRSGISPFGLFTNSLYEALTKGGEKRQIYRSMPGMATKERKQDMLIALLSTLAANPSFSDTVNVDNRKSIMKELNLSDQPVRYLKSLIMDK